ncbi:dTDP-glucose 4,6-dehydratase [Haloferula luteola]|uniref:dTDP-glucose 4,6-dehydratase n=1 Tax=Haloferula luteola TaxID=595692 RepID=A0A840VD62_9BACT|nr:dTDP-glucose 4,6-dehydratase [Haloferula luteola]MBB5350791.1 dTDP-glucose 4,6-dehydratase [Haloferula luteola]
MNVLVTGGAGFIGSNLVRRLLGQGHQVAVVDKLTYAGRWASLEELSSHPGFRFFQADITDRMALDHIFAAVSPEAVMHLAAESHVDRSILGPAAFVQTNLVGTFVLLEATLAAWTGSGSWAGKRFIHVSTDEVFGELGEVGQFTEESRYAPRSPYSASKAGSDHLVRAWGTTYGLPVLVAHSSNNYGPFQFPEKLVPQVILRAMAGERIPVYGSGLQVRDWLHVEDHVAGLCCLLERGNPGETYLFGGNHERRNLDWVHDLCRRVDDRHPASDGRPHASRIVHVVDRPGHDFRYALDTTQTQRELGWQPSRDPDRRLAETVDWYLDHEEWWRPIFDEGYRFQEVRETS